MKNIIIITALAFFSFSSCIEEAQVGPIGTDDPDADVEDTDADVEDSDADNLPDCIEGSDEDLCTAQGHQCGTHEMGFRCDVERTTIRCGDCSWPDECTDAFQCLCEPLDCDDLRAECGTHDNGCGSTVTCSPCPGEEKCTHRSRLSDNGLTDPNPESREFLCTDECIPLNTTAACAGIECGEVSDGCGDTILCSPVEHCSFGGESFGDWEFVSQENCCNSGSSCTCVDEELRAPACINNECVLIVDDTRTVRNNCNSCALFQLCVGGTCGIFN